jgi:flagellar motor switch protein FliM
MRWNVTTPETGPAPSEPDAQSPSESPVPPAVAPARATAAPATAAPTSAARSRRGEPRTYDFRRPTKLSREHVRVLQIAQEAFARQATTILTTFLRAGARLELVGIEQFSYDDYVVTLPNPVFISTFSLEPLAGKGMLAYPLDIAMAIVDHMLGGSGRADQPSRPMTAMETTITNHLLDRLLDEFAVSFRMITEIQPALLGHEYNPQLAQAAAGSDTVMVATFTMSVGTREGEATLVLPFSSFAQALNNAASPQLSESALRKRKRAALPRRRRRPAAAPPAGRPARGHHQRRDVRVRDRQQPPAPACRRHRPDPVRRREGHRVTELARSRHSTAPPAVMRPTSASEERA